jgi:RHS repeat-associated protein
VVREVDPDGRAWSVANPNVNGGADPAVVDRFVFDGQDIVLQFDGTGALTHRYLHGPLVDQVLADERFTPSSAGQQPSSPGAVLFPLADHQNTTRDLVDASGTVVNHLSYDSFGKLTAETNAAVDYLFGYAGMERDEETGLDRADHRFYDPGIERWLTEDPIGFVGGDYNLRRYIGNGPTNGTDPTGLVEWHWHHFYDQAIFTQDFLQQHGLSGLNVHAQEHGWMLRQPDHTGPQGLHALGWSKDWSNWIIQQNQSGTPITESSLKNHLTTMRGKYGPTLSKGFEGISDYKFWNAQPGWAKDAACETEMRARDDRAKGSSLARPSSGIKLRIRSRSGTQLTLPSHC